MDEAAIRDLLARDLSVLEGGLQLCDTEQFIPAAQGTRSFLDIFAKDSAGHWVIIEVKKTNVASRQAAHEVFKYVEAVQRHLGARNDEIRVLVASMEWAEMLVPFSRLRKETSIAIEGVQLELSNCGVKLRAVPVVPLELSQGRYLAEWHELSVYRDESSLELGIASYGKCCTAKGLNDYILVVLKAAEDFHERALETLHFLSRSCPDYELPRSEYILYFAPQILTKEFCISVIESDSDLLEEVLSATASMDRTTELYHLHSAVYGLEPRPHRDDLEIGYCAKFANKLLIDEKWSIERVLRFGMFDRNHLLSDAAIIEELKGLSGNSGSGFRRSINLTNSAHVSAARDGLANALHLNHAWQAQTKRVLDDICECNKNVVADIGLLNPPSGVFTLYHVATGGWEYAPQYQVTVTDSDGFVNAKYFGCLVPAGNPKAFQEILGTYYDGRLGRLMFLASIPGFYEPRYAEILDDLGLAYRTFRLDDPDGDARWFQLRDDLWKPLTPSPTFFPLQPFKTYFEKQSSLVRHLVDAIGSRMHNGFHDMS